MRQWIILPFALFLFVSTGAAQAPSDQVPARVLHQIAAEFQQGNVPEAERGLRAALEESPHDPAALSLLGVILDAQQRYSEAESAYQKALAAAPGAPGILNNLGNHYMAEGKTDPARAAFLKVVAVDPRHPNANLQLAQLSVASKQGGAALKYLDRLPPENQSLPPVAILRARALKLAGQDQAAGKLLGTVDSKAASDPSVAFSVGMAFAEWQRYADAERAFTAPWMRTPQTSTSYITWASPRSTRGIAPGLWNSIVWPSSSVPTTPIVFTTWGLFYMQTGHSDDAVVPLMQAS